MDPWSEDSEILLPSGEESLELGTGEIWFRYSSESLSVSLSVGWNGLLLKYAADAGDEGVDVPLSELVCAHVLLSS